MDDNSFYEYLVGIFIFMLFITNLFRIVENTNTQLRVIGNQLEIDNVVYERKDYEYQEQVIKGEEIIVMLMDDLEYDIRINSMVINKDIYNSYIDFSLIKGDYSKSYEFDQTGSITCIVFKSITPTHS